MRTYAKIMCKCGRKIGANMIKRHRKTCEVCRSIRFNKDFLLIGKPTYDVKALIEDVPGCGKRVCAVKVTFIKPSKRGR